MLDDAQVKNLARLARLALGTEETAMFARELSGILALVEQMNAVDTTGVDPLAHPIEPRPRRRVDAVTERDRRGDFAAVAPKVEGGYYLVPRVIE